ncbi:MAG: CocE/NonD family hydrolase [Eggerthellaceae bacterium]|nr:CocE/NonD family hydrolase [Eggerthellaceae bacterium]
MYEMVRSLMGVDNQALSGLMKWEGPDPDFWCARGLAICSPDARGARHSEGNICYFNELEGEDGHDLVEWLGVQSWCNGKVGLAGNFWLAVSQWFIAAECPEHLSALPLRRAFQTFNVTSCFTEELRIRSFPGW